MYRTTMAVLLCLSLSIRLTMCSTGQSEIRVLKDDAPIERTEYNDREAADSDKQLGMCLRYLSIFYLFPILTTIRTR